MQAKPIDVRALIDDRPLTAYQIVVVVLCGLAAALDGLDTLGIAIAGPSMVQTLALKMSDLGPIVAIGTLGAAFGALGGGRLADRIGRKTVLIAAVVVFAVFTLATAFTGSLGTLLAYRFLAGLGLGAAAPCFVALTSEFAPARLRGTLVGLVWTGFSLGAMLGSFLDGWLIGRFGWPAIFYVGGILPLAMILLLVAALPESLKFLIARGGRDGAVGSIVARLTRQPVAAGARFVANEPAIEGGSFRQLFSDGRGLVTVCLWVPFFMAFGLLAFTTIWTPALLQQTGMSASDTGIVVGLGGIGALIGMASSGRLVDRFGAVRVLTPAFIVAAAAIVALGAPSPSLAYATIVLGLTGIFLGGGAAGAIALAALSYPTAIRSTGVGWAMGMGRLGQVASPLAAGALLGAGLGSTQIMPIMSIAALLAAASVTLVGLAARRHSGLTLAAAPPA